MMFNSNIVATTPDYKDINKIKESAGRFLVNSDSGEKQNVCVLGANVAAKLFPFGNALDETILIDKFSYVVVGIAAPSTPISSSNPNQAAEDHNNDVYIPLGTADGRFGKTVFLRQSGTRSGEQVQFSQVTLTVAETDEVRRTGDSIKAVLEDHERKDTILDVPLDKLEAAEREKIRFTILLAIIGGISLLVGGIGIMNIMLATVTERTREIGIRRALGAKRSDITMQFLIEAVVQTTIGGLVGVSFGLLVIYCLPTGWQRICWAGMSRPSSMCSRSFSRWRPPSASAFSSAGIPPAGPRCSTRLRRCGMCSQAGSMDQSH